MMKHLFNYLSKACQSARRRDMGSSQLVTQRLTVAVSRAAVLTAGVIKLKWWPAEVNGSNRLSVLSRAILKINTNPFVKIEQFRQKYACFLAPVLSLKQQGDSSLYVAVEIKWHKCVFLKHTYTGHKSKKKFWGGALNSCHGSVTSVWHISANQYKVLILWWNISFLIGVVFSEMTPPPVCRPGELIERFNEVLQTVYMWFIKVALKHLNLPCCWFSENWLVRKRLTFCKK